MYKITVPTLNLVYYQENLAYVKYQKENDIMLMCNKEEAQGILSKDYSVIYQFREEDVLKEKYHVCKIEEISFDEMMNEMDLRLSNVEAQNNALIDGVKTSVTQKESV